MKTKALSLFVVLCIFSVLMSGCGQRTVGEAETPPPEASTSSDAPEASPTAENPPTSAVEEPKETAPLEQAMEQAEEAFSNGFMIYIYGPQPKTVSASEVYNPFKASYILSEDATELSGVMTVMRYVDLDGNKEMKTNVNTSGPDMSSKTGYFTFNRALGAIYDQAIVVLYLSVPFVRGFYRRGKAFGKEL